MISYFGKNNWGLTKFIGEYTNNEWRANILEVIQILISQLINNKTLWKDNALINITNKPKKLTFNRNDCVAFIHNNGLITMITEAFSLGTDKKLLLSILKNLCTLAQMCNERLVYDVLAERMLNAGTFVQVLNLIKTGLESTEEMWMVKVLELAATLPEGILLLSQNLQPILELLNRNLKRTTGNYMNSIVTLILDLTANENCIEEVAEFLVSHEVFSWVLSELHKEFSKTERTKYKDILMGIVLNLSCNIESDEIQKHFLELNTPRVLVDILFDSRNNWPSNGSSLALMQYARKSFESYWIYQIMNEEKIRNGMKRYLRLEGLVKAKENIKEALNYLEIADEKQRSIKEITVKQVIAMAA
jgi:hypothetical protein